MIIEFKPMLGSAVDLDTPNLIIQQENIENKQNKVGAKMFFFVIFELIVMMNNKIRCLLRRKLRKCL